MEGVSPMSQPVSIDRPNTGGWVPPELVESGLLFSWPPKPTAVLKWLFGWGGYLFPYNALYFLMATVLWYYLTPDLATMKTLQLGWVAQLFAVNLVFTIVWTSIWHVYFYVRKSQDTEFKFNNRWPKNTDTFLFGNQLVDNVFWSLAGGVTVWTAYLVLTLWMMSNGWIPYLDMHAHPIYFAVVGLCTPLFRDLHFYCIHRLIHIEPLYKWFHSIHHKNANPIPWSGLAMHPVEHIIFFSSVLIHWVTPSNPLLVISHLLQSGASPAQDHSGFGKVSINGKVYMDAASYVHYLHHRYFEVNYGDGGIPLDRIFGTWHDGSMESHKRMNDRFKQKQFKR